MSCHAIVSIFINSLGSYKLTAAIHPLKLKCNSFCLSESTIPYCFFPNIKIFRLVRSYKYFLIITLLFSGDIQLNSGPAPSNNVSAASPLDVFESVSYPS